VPLRGTGLLLVDRPCPLERWFEAQFRSTLRGRCGGTGKRSTEGRPPATGKLRSIQRLERRGARGDRSPGAPPTFNAGETIFNLGSPGDHMMAVLGGSVRITVPSPDGRELLLALIQPGEVFGELAVLDGKERSADAVAETACTLAMLYRRDVLSFFQRNPSAWPKLVEVLCQRLRRTDQVFAEVALLQLPIRLAKMMLRLLESRSSSEPARGAKISFSQRELANMVGGTRESVNRCLRNWQQKGIVQISEGAIVVVKQDALEDIAEMI
jgi:CRP/FNR family transcriptional regulator, cyclic AMP receptor protein